MYTQIRKVFLVLSVVLSVSLFVACQNPTSSPAENDLSAPTGVTVTTATTGNRVTVKWTDNGATKYWVYYNSTNDTSTATCASKYETSGTYGCDISLPSTGTYYFWVKAADGYSSTSATSDFSSVATYDFTYTTLSAPTNISVTNSSKTNYVTVKWTNNGATKYWVYYNSTNDASTATCTSKYETSGTYGCDILLTESGTYYFWVKSADGYTSTSATSDFSSTAQFAFTYTALSAPLNASVSSTSTDGKVTVKWTNNGAAKYWVYYNSTNDTSTATCASKFETNGTYGCDITLSSTGTYYFWVKAADGYSQTSNTSDFSSVATYTY